MSACAKIFELPDREGASDLILSVKVFDRTPGFGVAESVTIIRNPVTDGRLGVPEITPVAGFKLNPLGRESPCLTLKA